MLRSAHETVSSQAEITIGWCAGRQAYFNTRVRLRDRKQGVGVREHVELTPVQRAEGRTAQECSAIRPRVTDRREPVAFRRIEEVERAGQFGWMDGAGRLCFADQFFCQSGIVQARSQFSMVQQN